jgi:predicted RNA binding protein YcfA (HicA-like mRNA interferase family)
VKVPRDLRGSDLVKALSIFGYVPVRQTGSHIRLRSAYTGTEHLITIPNHNPIKLGTVQGILADVAQNLKMTKQELIERLFL